MDLDLPPVLPVPGQSLMPAVTQRSSRSTRKSLDIFPNAAASLPGPAGTIGGIGQENFHLMYLLCDRWAESREVLLLEWGEGPTVAGLGLRSLCPHRSSAVSTALHYRLGVMSFLNEVLICFR